VPSPSHKFISREEWLALQAKPPEQPPEPTGPRGLGDFVASMIAKVAPSIAAKPCGGCKARQEALNRIVPFSKS